jgi:hypothetical protein
VSAYPRAYGRKACGSRKHGNTLTLFPLPSAGKLPFGLLSFLLCASSKYCLSAIGQHPNYFCNSIFGRLVEFVCRMAAAEFKNAKSSSSCTLREECKPLPFKIRRGSFRPTTGLVAGIIFDEVRFLMNATLYRLCCHNEDHGCPPGKMRGVLLIPLATRRIDSGRIDTHLRSGNFQNKNFDREEGGARRQSID